MAVLDITQFNQLVQEVREALLADAQGVSEVEVVSSLSNIRSLPALRIEGAKETVVEAPIELLSAPAVEAAVVAIGAAEEATVAATNADASADLADAERTGLEELKGQTEAAKSLAIQSAGKADISAGKADASALKADAARKNIEANEDSRKVAEVNRESSETGRETSEQERKGAEVFRVLAENVRLDSELERMEAEDMRASAENTRETNDGLRKTAEEVRQVAETGRETSEKDRKDAEALRVLAEDNRVKEFGSLKDASETATENATSVAEHQPYIGEDYYFYQWNLVTKSYNKTNTYTKGEGFSIFQSYKSIELMLADKDNVPQGRFVIINTKDVENPDNAQVYFRNETSETGFDFVVDMSGAIGFKGKTPQFTVGNTVTGIEGSEVAVSLSENGVDEGGNPVYAINLSVPRGDKGKVPGILIGEVTTVSPDIPASATLVPDGQLPDGTPRYKLNLSIPKGNEGSLQAGDAKYLTATFVEATERANVKTGETISTLFGKVCKFFADLKKVAFTGAFADLENIPDTVEGYGIKDASKTGHKHGKADISDFPDSMPASDVPDWAKDDKKPVYTAKEVGASPADHKHEGVYEPVFEKKGAFNNDYGTTSGTVCQGNDERLNNARTPTEHSHPWNKIDDKPLLFPPVNHGHSWGDISGKPDSMPASDVPDWAKKPNKPSYSASDVGASPANHNHDGTYESKSYHEGANTVGTLSALPINKRSITASLGGATNISLSAGMTVGRELVISITPTVSFDQPIPVAGGWSSLDGDKITLSAGKIAEISILCVADSKYIISSKTSE